MEEKRKKDGRKTGGGGEELEGPRHDNEAPWCALLCAKGSDAQLAVEVLLEEDVHLVDEEDVLEVGRVAGALRDSARGDELAHHLTHVPLAC